VRQWRLDWLRASLVQAGITLEAATETYAKRLQILKEIVPKVNRVAVLQAQGDAHVKFAMASLEGVAPNLGIQLYLLVISSYWSVECWLHSDQGFD
jgi:ABC-type uncharacterized transport system substrate-binding protein